MDENRINFGGNNQGSREPGQDIMSTLDKNSGFQDKDNARTIIKVMGVGGGGNNAINHMYLQNIEGVSFVVLNTDRQQLNQSPVPNRVLLGPNTTHGLGAGNVPDVAVPPRRARPKSPPCSMTTPRWSSSPPVWVVVPVPVLLPLWHALPTRKACSPSVS